MSPSLISQFRGSHWYGVGKSKAVFGPFVGGINKTRDPNFVEPHQLQDCINYIIKPDGRLIGRPPVKSYDTSSGLPAGFTLSIIGSGSGGNVRAGTGFNGPVAFDTTGFKTWIYSPITDAWTQFSTAFPANVDFAYKMATYNGINYIVASDSLNSANKFIILPGMTNNASYSTLANSVFGAGVIPDSANLIFLKDRAIVIADRVIIWSKATDPTVWAVPDGGFAKFDGDATAGSFMYQDSIYIFGGKGIWRFSFSSDPSIDASLEHLSAIPIFSATAYNNEIYVATGSGVHKFLNGFFVELSQNIRYDWENKIKALTGTSQLTLSVIENFLLVGPFGTTTQFYYVYDFQQQIWTSWQFGSGSGAVKGPQFNKPVPAGTAYNLGIKRWLWDFGSAVYSMPADGLSGGTVYGGYDTDSAGQNYWMGFKLTTAEVDLGDGNRWKRVFKSLLESVYTAVVFTAGTSKINLILDGVTTTLTPPETGKLAWGKSFRAKRVGLQYDSTGNTIGTATTPAVELNNIDRFEVYIREAEEVTT